MGSPGDHVDELARLRAELDATRAERDAAREQLGYAQDLIASQQLMIEELGAPFIPVSDGLAIVPLVGPFERARLERLGAQLSEAVTVSGTRTVVLDLTGVGVLEPGGEVALVNCARTLDLLGARTIFTGIGPEVARALADSEEPALDDFEYRRSLRRLLEVRTR